jgi:hypothetical protein
MVAPTAVCVGCGVEAKGAFAPCPVCRLAPEDRKLFDLFLESRGNLKKVERTLGLSYPTVRQRVEELFLRMGYPKDPPKRRLDILARVRDGTLTVDEAAEMLRR